MIKIGLIDFTPEDKVLSILDKNNVVKAKYAIDKNDVWKHSLMSENHIEISFFLNSYVAFKRADYILWEGEKFSLRYDYLPEQQNKRKYKYTLKFEAVDMFLKDIQYYYLSQDLKESEWRLFGNPEYFIKIAVDNANRYFGTTDFKIGTIEPTEAKDILFEVNTTIFDALTQIAEEYDAEWYVTDKIINLVNKLEFGDEVDFETEVSVLEMKRDEGDKKEKYTRILALGSERNIPRNYRGTEEGEGVDAIYSKRLRIPLTKGSTIDAYPNMANDEAIEGTVIFDNVYPKRVGTIESISTIQYQDKDEETGKVTKWDAYKIKDSGIDFKDEYLLPNIDLRLQFVSGDLNGMDFDLFFKDKGFTNTDNSQYFEIKRNDDYGKDLPNATLKPKVSDKYVLYGFDIALVGDQYVPEAEQELYDEAVEWLEKQQRDTSVYECPTAIQYFTKNNLDLDLGQRVKLLLDKSDRSSRIMGFEKKLNNKFDAVYTVGDNPTYSRFNKIEKEIKELQVEGMAQSQAGNIYVIKNIDSTRPTDFNVFSSKKAINSFHRKDISDSTDYLQKFNKGAEFGDYKNKKGAYINEEGKADFNEVQSNKVITKDLVATNTKTTKLEAIESTLSKATINDLVAQLATIHNLSVTDTANILRAVVGSVSSDTFKSGFLGEGFRIYEAINGDWNLEIDNVIVRKVFSVFELIVQKITHQGGMVIHSPNGAKITKVTDGGSYWKCEHDSAADFFKDDQILCQNFSGDNVKRYWRLATSAGKGYLNLSKTDQEANSSIPSIGDEIVVLGNRTNINRQSAIMVVAVGNNAPYTAYYSNINSYSLVGKESTRIGNLNGVVDKDFGALKGNGLYSENVFLKGIFRLTNGRTVEQELLSTNNTVEANRLQLGSEIDKANALAKNAQDAVDGLEIGIANIITKGDTPRYSDKYMITDYILSVPLPHGTPVTLVIKCKTFKGFIGIFGNNGNNGQKANIPSESNDYRIHVKRWNVNVVDQDVFALRLYNIPSTPGQTADIEWACLYIGDVVAPLEFIPSLSDQQTELKRLDTSIRTDFDVIEGKINMNVAETQRLVSVSNNHVAEATQASNKAQQNADKAKTEADLANKKALEAQANADKTKADATASNQAKLDAQAKANEAKAQADKANQEATKAKNDADKAKQAKDASEGILQSVTTKEANINVVAGQVDIKAKQATESATRAVNAEASINTKAGSIVMEASEKSAKKAIDGLGIGVNNLIKGSGDFLVVKNKDGYIGHGWASIGGIDKSILCNGNTVRYIKADWQGFNFGLDDMTEEFIVSFSARMKDENTSCIFSSPLSEKLKQKFIYINGISNINTTEWKRYGMYFPNGGVVKSIENGLIEFSRFTADNGVYVSEVCIRLGNKEIGWSPAPEDIQSQFTETNASLKVLNDQIASEVSKTNGIRTDLTRVQQSHNEFKVQVVEDVADAIDRNNEVVKSSFGMKDNVLTAYGKEFNVLANLKVGNETILTKDGKIRTKLLDVEEIEDNTIFGGFVFMNGLLISQEGTDADGNFSTNWIEYKMGNFKPNLILDPKKGSNTALEGQFGLFYIVGKDIIGKSADGNEVMRITANKVPDASVFKGEWVLVSTNTDIFNDSFFFDNTSIPSKVIYKGKWSTGIKCDKVGQYRIGNIYTAYHPSLANPEMIGNIVNTITVRDPRGSIVRREEIRDGDVVFYANTLGTYSVTCDVFIEFTPRFGGKDVAMTIGIDSSFQGVLYKSTPPNTTLIGSDGLYTSFSSEEFLHYKANEGFILRSGNYGLRVSKSGIQKWNGSQWVTANI